MQTYHIYIYRYVQTGVPYTGQIAKLLPSLFYWGYMEVSIVMGVHPIAGLFFLRENPSINGWFWGSHILMEIPYSISQQKLGELWLSSPPIELQFFYCNISQYTIPMISPIWLVWIWYSHLKKKQTRNVCSPPGCINGAPHKRRIHFSGGALVDGWEHDRWTTKSFFFL